jgi:hypothetical protein
MPLDSTTSITIAGVQCWDAGTEENFSRQSRSRAARSLLCQWTDRVALINAVLSPLATQSAAPVLGVGVFDQPYAYPQAPWLLLEEVRCKGIAGEQGLSEAALTALDGTAVSLVAYKYAAVTFIYASQDYPAQETGLLSLDFGVETLSAPRSAAAFSYVANGPSGDDPNDVPPEDSPALRETVVTLTRTRKNLTSLPTDLILAAAQAPVNSVPFTMVNAGVPGLPADQAPAGTVKFEGVSTRYRMVAGGASMWDASFRFIYRASGWNNLYRPGQGYVPIYFKGTDQPYYPISDLNQLLV